MGGEEDRITQITVVGFVLFAKDGRRGRERGEEERITQITVVGCVLFAKDGRRGRGGGGRRRELLKLQ